MMTAFPLRFDGPVGRLRYAAWAFGIFISQHIIALGVVSLTSPQYLASIDWYFALIPLRWFSLHWFTAHLWPAGVPTMFMVSAFLYHLFVAWALLALSFRRAIEANVRPWITGFVILPGIQIPVILALSLVPSRRNDATKPAAALPEQAMKWTKGAEGLLAGIALTVGSVVVGTLAFGSYGIGVFVITPFLVGMTTAMIVNSNGDRGSAYTNRLVINTIVLGALVLIAVAIEGFICLVMAAPLGIPMAWLGGLLGRAIALQGQNTPRQTLSSVSMLPIVLVGEVLFAPVASFDTINSVTIAAPPDRVWQSIVAMDPIEGAPSLGSRLGMAFPTGATIIGEGIGATRLGHFSTGTAEERITAWQPGRMLAFSIIRDVPAMREISPYNHVHAPHAIGYFFTHSTSFEIVEEERGTRLIERTSHSLKLEPAFYWLTLARFMVDHNNARVLRHIKNQAERVR
jgi:hypothetical protein